MNDDNEPVLINIPRSMLEDFIECLPHSGLVLFKRNDGYIVRRIPEFIRARHDSEKAI